MRKPALIEVRKSGEGIYIGVSGYKGKKSRPYIFVETTRGSFGYIEDKDIKRLLTWCKDCFKRGRK